MLLHFFFLGLNVSLFGFCLLMLSVFLFFDFSAQSPVTFAPFGGLSYSLE